MQFRVLGPLEVCDEGRVLPLPGGKQRLLLALLLLRAGQVAPVTELVDALWEHTPPKTAVTQLHGLVSRLRKNLFPPSDTGGPQLVTRPPGYQLQLAPDSVDIRMFERLAALGRQLLQAGTTEAAADTLREAMALWRGPALGEISASVIRREATRLEDMRLTVLSDRMDADLGLGRHDDIVGELESLASAHPYRERVASQLILALHRSGRSAEALDVYRRTRDRLVDELGLEPGAELRRLQQGILARDATLEAVAPPADHGTRGVPAQLPADLAGFTGRDKQLDQLCDVLRRDAADGPVVVSAVAGQAGVGKTTLAVHTAHRLREMFSDGQLYVNLRGVDAAPVEPGEVLGRFLRALGVDGPAMPDGTDERAALYRSMLATKRVLVVLDNAGGEDQVRPLLPGGPRCGVMITSRTRLAALEGAWRLDLDVLDNEQALELLAQAAGPERVAATPEAAETIVALCGGLPLAVRIAGARLAARPDWPLARLADRLADERHRLDELSAGDLEVRGSLTLSYTALTREARRALRLLGSADLPEFAAWVLAPLLDTDLAGAERLVDTLVRAQLLVVIGTDVTGQSRYRLHDLVRIYAHERAESDEPDASRRVALRRLVAAWLTLADHGAHGLHSGIPRPQRGPAPRWHFEPGQTAALLSDPHAWFDLEAPSLLAAVELAEALDLDDSAWELFGALVGGRFMVGSQFEEWWHVHRAALDVVRRRGNRRGEAIIECGTGLLYFRQDRFAEAVEHFQRSVTIFHALGRDHDEAIPHCGLAITFASQNRLVEASRHADHALSTFEARGDPHAAACACEYLGAIRFARGAGADALGPLHRALSGYRRFDDRRGEANTSIRIGRAHLARDELAAALEWLGRARRHFGRLGDRAGYAEATHHLATVLLQQGRTAEAWTRLQECLATYESVGRPASMARVLTALGELHLRGGHLDDAAACLDRASAIWARRDMPLWRAHTLLVLGDLHEARADTHRARHAWQEARTLFADRNRPEARQAASRLNSTSDAS